MAARYSYSNPYQADELAMYQYQQQMMMHQSAPRRFFGAIGRFLYRLTVLTLIVGAVGGVLFALYKNDVLLSIARGAGIEAQYRSFEKTIGAANWGPRTVQPPADDTTAAPVIQAAAADGANPSDKPAETVRAAVEPKAATADGVAIVSFDSLPTAPTKAAPETVNASPEPAKHSRAEPVSIARAAAAGPTRPSPKPKAEKPAKPTELTRSIPLPKAPPKPEPVAKAEPKPEPPPPPKPAPEEDHTKPRANDNPLKAAIRASMAAKKSD